MGMHWVDRFSRHKLRQLRTDRGLSQEALATRVGKLRQTIIGYETGAHKPRARALTKLAAALDVTVDDLLDPGAVDMSLLRARRGLKQDDVAAELGVSYTTYQRYESRRARIARDRLVHLAKILQTDEETLAGLLDVRPDP